MTPKKNARDGFEVVTYPPKSETVHFVECDFDGNMREKVLRGLLRNMDTDRFIVIDTRDVEVEREAGRRK